MRGEQVLWRSNIAVEPEPRLARAEIHWICLDNPKKYRAGFLIECRSSQTALGKSPPHVSGMS